MALHKICFSDAMGGGAPVAASIPNQVETLTGNGTTTIEAVGGEFVTIFSDVAAHFAIGLSPSAGTTTGWVIAAGATETRGPLREGDKVAIVAI